MSDTPISDSTPHNVADLGMRIRMIERELNAANSINCQQQLLDEANLRLQDRIKRLEAAGDEMAAWLLDPRNLGGGSSMASQWLKAKEAKP
jgi:chromosome condensin MukBEF complex kleisin-like MukF subunit